jgi:hypothetical protein
LAEQEACYRAEWQAVHETDHPQPWKDWKLAQLEQKRSRERLVLNELITALRRRSGSPSSSPNPLEGAAAPHRKPSVPDGGAPMAAASTLPEASIVDGYEGGATRTSRATEAGSSVWQR